MIVISEWLPNPKGEDTKGEWVELRNSGGSPVDLTDWRLTADGKKFYTLQGAIGPGMHAVLPRTETKITLRNADGKLALYDANGRLADQAHFAGSAPEGESANRSQAGSFFGRPTPGKANISTGTNTLAYDNEYPFDVPLGPPNAAMPQFTGYLLGTALALAAAVVFILKSYEDLSHLFFNRD